MERDALAERIRTRTERMLAGGALEEVAEFRQEHGVESTRPGLPGICSAIGYREIVEYSNGDLDYEECLESIAAATRRYARRQTTWLRRVKDAVMIEVTGREPAQVAGEIVGLAARITGQGVTGAR